MCNKFQLDVIESVYRTAGVHQRGRHGIAEVVDCSSISFEMIFYANYCTYFTEIIKSGVGKKINILAAAWHMFCIFKFWRNEKIQMQMNRSFLVKLQ